MVAQLHPRSWATPSPCSTSPTCWATSRARPTRRRRRGPRPRPGPRDRRPQGHAPRRSARRTQTWPTPTCATRPLRGDVGPGPGRAAVRGRGTLARRVPVSALGRRLRGHLGLAALAAFVVADVVLVALALDSTAATPDSAGSARDPPPSRRPHPGRRRAVTPRRPRARSPARRRRRRRRRPGARPARGGGRGRRRRHGLAVRGGELRHGRLHRDHHPRRWEHLGAHGRAVRCHGADPGQGHGGAFAVGSDDSCTPRFRQAAKDATTWGSPMSVPGAWYRDPSDPAVVGTAAGTGPSPVATPRSSTSV